jgi:hypothetical protein
MGVLGNASKKLLHLKKRLEGRAAQIAALGDREIILPHIRDSTEG